MRRSSYFHSVYALYRGFEKIKPALDFVSADTEQEVNTSRRIEQENGEPGKDLSHNYLELNS